ADSPHVPNPDDPQVARNLAAGIDSYGEDYGRRLEEGFTDSFARTHFAELARAAGLDDVAGALTKPSWQGVRDPYRPLRAMVDAFVDPAAKSGLFGDRTPAQIRDWLALENSFTRPGAMADEIIKATGLPDTPAVHDRLIQTIRDAFNGDLNPGG